MSLATYQPSWIYPQSQQFPFDETASRIVQALRKRNWKVPGIDVEFDVYGTGEEKFRLVRHIRGKDFKLWFCRVQRHLNDRMNDTAAVTEITIPRFELNVFEDESGPTLYVYAGDDWERDAERFMNGIKTNSRLHREGKWYIRYTGSQDFKRHYTYTGRRPQFLVPDSDSREYQPELGEADYFVTSIMFTRFDHWLRDNVLAAIEKHPEVPETPFPKPVLVPFPWQHFYRFPWVTQESLIYTYVGTRDAERILAGQKNRFWLQPHERYAIQGGGWRLVPLGVRDESMPKEAEDGFAYCNVGPVNPKKLGKLPDYLGKNYRWDDNHVFRVKPIHANGIYIADLKPAEDYKDRLSREFPNLRRLTEEQYLEYQRITGRTMTPIEQYHGGFKAPTVLIGRELDFDEVEYIGELPKKRY